MATSLALYAIADSYVAAVERLSDMDLPDDVIADTLEGLAGELEAKATNVAAFVRNLEASADAIKQAESQMSARRKAIENRAQRVKDYLLLNMERTGISKIECPHFKIAVRENPPSVVIDMAQAIPEDYMCQPEPPPAQPDKTLIARALKDGFDVPGAHLTRTKRVEIR